LIVKSGHRLVGESEARKSDWISDSLTRQPAHAMSRRLTDAIASECASGNFRQLHLPTNGIVSVALRSGIGGGKRKAVGETA
jgi:hypothetical protein